MKNKNQLIGCCGLDCEKCDARIATITDDKTPFCDKLCPVHNCVRKNGLDTCADCSQMDGCQTIGIIAANSPFVLDNLNWLREAAEKGSLKDE